MRKTLAMRFLIIAVLVCCSLSNSRVSAVCTGKATYKVTFTALWTATSHPTQYPSSAHWSGLVGGSHNSMYTMWQPGGKSTTGMKNMAELGSQRTLLNEMRAQGSNVLDTLALTVIGSGTGMTSGNLDVDGSHSLVSLVTMIAPSPDWFAGVHGLDLCNQTTWTQSRTVDLFPYDAGTDSGLKFTSSNSATNPREAIFRLTGTNPNNAQGSFYGYTTVPRMATLGFVRTSLTTPTPKITKAATTDTATTQAATTDTATTDAETTPAATTEAATTEAATTDAATTDAATTDAATTDDATTDAATTDAATTDAATTDAATTEGATTDAATLKAATTKATDTEAASTKVVTIKATTTKVGTMEAATTNTATTIARASEAATTSSATTNMNAAMTQMITEATRPQTTGGRTSGDDQTSSPRGHGSAAPSRGCTGQATYQVTYETIWTVERFPKDFPPNPHFSGLIGGSHNSEYVMWEPGKMSTRGMEAMAEDGKQLVLLIEMEEQGDNMLQYLAVGGIGSGTGRRSRSLTVDSAHSLISLVSMIAPSPDWFVGVRGLDMCDSSAGWKEFVASDLFPYDAGTDNGLKFNSPNSDTQPREGIHRLTNTMPDNTESSFYGPTAVPHIATLRFNLTSVGDSGVVHKAAATLTYLTAVLVAATIIAL